MGLRAQGASEEQTSPPSIVCRLDGKRVCSVIALQLQKLKRSLSFKTKSLRSKSADNFFQPANSDGKLPSLAESPGSPAPTPTKAGPHPGGKAHAFQEYIFKKPTFCDVCNHMIVGKAFPALPSGPSTPAKSR